MGAVPPPIAGAIALCVAACSYPAIVRGGRGTVALAIALVLATPLLVAGEHRLARFLVMVIAVAMAVKLYDLHYATGLGLVPGWWWFIVSLPNLSSIVLREADREPLVGRCQCLGRMSWGLLQSAAGLCLLVGAFHFDWHPWPFALEHCVKVLAFFSALLPFIAASASFLRLFGWRPREPMDHPFLARTPADFWRRYNRATQQFFLEDVFKPAGGLRRPVRATLLTFVVSALIHEYVLDVSAGRIQGYQTAFFLLQGCAVAATARVKPRGLGAIPWIAATLAFNLATGILFFASVNELVPFYVPRP
jgi:hypothetical protein